MSEGLSTDPMQTVEPAKQPIGRSLRVLCVHNGYELYGADRCFALAVRALAAHFPTADLKYVLPKPGPILTLPPLDRLPPTIRYTWILRRSSLVRGFTRDIIKNIRAVWLAYRDMRRADYVYINTIVMFDHILASRFARKRTVVHVHEIPNGLELTMFRALLRFSNAALIFNSNATRAAFALSSKIPQIVAYNGTSDVADWEDHTPSSVIDILMVGRLNHWKGQEILIDAIAHLPDESRSKISVRIVGSEFDNSGKFRAALQERISKLGLDGIVHLCPFEADPSDSYRRADVVVVPSRLPEPFGIVAIEAMAFGKPVIASRHGGLSEIVVDRETGRLFQPGDVAALSEIFRDLIAQRKTFEAYGKAGRRRYENVFTERAAIKSFTKAICELWGVVREGTGE